MIGVLFDLDGVLIDSETIYTQLWEDIEKTYPTNVDNFAAKIKGNNLNKILNTYYPDKQIQIKVTRLIKDFESTMQYPIFPGVIDFVNELYSNNIPMAIVTSSGSDKMDRLFLQHPDFKKYFSTIVTGDMVSHSKPHPEAFLIAAKNLNINPEDCYVFEDSHFGIVAGKAAKSKVIALTTTFDAASLKIDKADIIINDFIGFKLKDMLSI